MPSRRDGFSLRTYRLFERVVSRMVMLVPDLRPDSSVVAEVRPSPNHNERKGGARPDMILLHYTGMRDVAAVSVLCSPASEVSAHYVVLEDGPSSNWWRKSGAPGMREGPGGRDRHQFVLDRHRDRQSGA